MNNKRWMAPTTFTLIRLVHSVRSYWESSIVLGLFDTAMETKIALNTVAAVKRVVDGKIILSVYYCTRTNGSRKYSTLKLIPDFVLGRTLSSIEINTLDC